MDGLFLKLKSVLEQSTVTGQLRLSNLQLSKLPSLPDSLDLTDVTDFGISLLTCYVYKFFWWLFNPFVLFDPYLIFIDISDNSISELDESFCLRLLNLQRFYGVKNFISSIPPAFSRFQLLKVLDLRYIFSILKYWFNNITPIWPHSINQCLIKL